MGQENSRNRPRASTGNSNTSSSTNEDLPFSLITIRLPHQHHHHNPLPPTSRSHHSFRAPPQRSIYPLRANSDPLLLQVTTSGLISSLAAMGGRLNRILPEPLRVNELPPLQSQGQRENMDVEEGLAGPLQIPPPPVSPPKKLPRIQNQKNARKSGRAKKSLPKSEQSEPEKEKSPKQDEPEKITVAPKTEPEKPVPKDALEEPAKRKSLQPDNENPLVKSIDNERKKDKFRKRRSTGKGKPPPKVITDESEKDKPTPMITDNESEKVKPTPTITTKSEKGKPTPTIAANKSEKDKPTPTITTDKSEKGKPLPTITTESEKRKPTPTVTADESDKRKSPKVTSDEPKGKPDIKTDEPGKGKPLPEITADEIDKGKPKTPTSKRGKRKPPPKVPADGKTLPMTKLDEPKKEESALMLKKQLSKPKGLEGKSSKADEPEKQKSSSKIILDEGQPKKARSLPEFSIFKDPSSVTIKNEKVKFTDREIQEKIQQDLEAYQRMTAAELFARLHPNIPRHAPKQHFPEVVPLEIEILPEQKKRRASLAKAISSYSVIKRDWKQQKGEEIEIIDDPVLKPRLVEWFSWWYSGYILSMVITSTFMFALYFFAYGILNGYNAAREMILPIFFAPSVLANAVDLSLVPWGLAFYAEWMMQHAHLEDYGYFLCFRFLKHTRKTRWICYYLFLVYMIAGLVVYCGRIDGTAAQLKDKMYKELLATNTSEFTEIEEFTNFDNMHIYWGCCGVNGISDWDETRVNLMFEPDINDTTKNITYYPWSCCDTTKYPCDTRTTLEMAYQDGCFEYELSLIYGVFWIGVIVQIIAMILAVIASYYIFVIEILVLRVDFPEAYDDEVHDYNTVLRQRDDEMTSWINYHQRLKHEGPGLPLFLKVVDGKLYAMDDEVPKKTCLLKLCPFECLEPKLKRLPVQPKVRRPRFRRRVSDQIMEEI